jgi:hypothetical protein
LSPLKDSTPETKGGKGLELLERSIKYITRVTVPSKTQQRLVHYQNFDQPIATEDIPDLSADGGKYD